MTTIQFPPSDSDREALAVVMYAMPQPERDMMERLLYLPKREQNIVLDVLDARTKTNPSKETLRAVIEDVLAVIGAMRGHVVGWES